MFRPILAIAAIALMSACTPRTVDVSHEFSLPPGLDDCQMFELRNSSGNRLYALRCPQSETAVVRPGKHPTRTAVIQD